MTTCENNHIDIIRKIDKRVFNRHGFCKTILFDNASYFDKKFKEFLENQNIKWTSGIPYRHTTNGLAKRNVRTVRERLRFTLTPGTKIKDVLYKAQST